MALPHAVAFLRYIRVLVKDRRANPEDDLVTALVRAAGDGGSCYGVWRATSHVYKTFREKYGARDVKNCYSTFDVAVVVEVGRIIYAPNAITCTATFCPLLACRRAVSNPQDWEELFP